MTDQPVLRWLGSPGTVGPEIRKQLLECWRDVSNAGGAVGFPFPPVSDGQVAASLDAMVSSLGEPGNRLLLATIDGELAGWLFLEGNSNRHTAHWARVLRVQTALGFRKRGVGRALMAEAARAAANDLDLDQLHLELRSGLGLEDFYASCGWHEIGRRPAALRVPDGDRDEVLMMLPLRGASEDCGGRGGSGMDVEPDAAASTTAWGESASLRDALRALPTIRGRAPEFDVEQAPAQPRGLFLEWLRHAIGAGVPEPHAATLSTIDASGMPDARVLIVKDVTGDCGFNVATGDDSAKGSQLLRNPQCALSFYWSPLARAVRVRGTARRAPDAASAADFRARHKEARAIALAGRQSAVLDSENARDESVAGAAAVLDADPDLVSPVWSVWTIVPESMEFWQGDPGRNHQRLRYLRTAGGWEKSRLWP